MKLLWLCQLVWFSLHLTWAQYAATWESLDSRPLPEWYDQAKIGIMIHWGVYSVPSFGSEWFWYRWKEDKLPEFVEYMEKNYPEGFFYEDFALDFTPELYNPAEWASLFRRAGARYVVLTSKHLEGYTLWPSAHSYMWNAQDVGPERDLLGELADAVRNEGLRFGAYYSLREWFNPLFHYDVRNDFTTSYFVRDKVMPELKDLITKYQPEVLYSDGDTNASFTYWRSTEFMAWLYNESPVKETVVTNDRWGTNMRCQHGGFYTCLDAYTRGTRKWENSVRLDLKSWGYRRNIDFGDIQSVQEIIRQTVRIISRGGNVLWNLGPTKSGTIPPIFQERLVQLGDWLSINGEAIYETTPWIRFNDSENVQYTAKNGIVYAIVHQWPVDNILRLDSIMEQVQGSDVTIRMLGFADPLEWEIVDGVAVLVTFPSLLLVSSQWTWVLRIGVE